MAGIIAPPAHQTVRTADGSDLIVAGAADASTLLLGVGGRAEFKPLKIVPNGGITDISKTLAGLLNALHGAGVDTSAVVGWTKGFDGVGVDGPAGWVLTYQSDALTVASAGLAGGQKYPDTLDAIYDPLGRGVSGNLAYRTGTVGLWPVAATVKFNWQKISNGSTFQGTGGVSHGAAPIGDTIPFGQWVPPTDNFAAPGVNYLGTSIIVSGVTVDREYQP